MLEVRLDRHQTHIRSLLKPKMQVTVAAGRRIGKTYFCSTQIHEIGLGRPGSRIGLLMPSLKQARATFWIPLLIPQFTGPLRRFVKRPNLTELTCEYLNGSRLTTWGAENAQSIRGQGFDFLVEDEADDIDPDIEASVVAPTLMELGSEAIWLRCGTPKRGRYGTLYINFQRGQDGTQERAALGDDASFYASYRCSSEESGRVDQVALAREKRALIARGQGVVYEREYKCNFDAAAGLVYPMFRQDLHVQVPDYGVPWDEILIGADWGFNDPGVYLVVGVIGQGKDATLHAIEEVYASERENSWWDDKAAELAWKYRHFRQRWYGDRSQPARIVGIRKTVRARHPELGDRFSIEESQSNAGDVEYGVSAVADRMCVRQDENLVEQTRFRIDPSCVNTIHEFGLYKRRRDPKNQDRVLDDIVDKDNHAMDCARYIVLGRFGGPDRTRHEVSAVQPPRPRINFG